MYYTKVFMIDHALLTFVCLYDYGNMAYLIVF